VDLASESVKTCTYEVGIRLIHVKIYQTSLITE
jgi:hypothetical protein